MLRWEVSTLISCDINVRVTPSKNVVSLTVAKFDKQSDDDSLKSLEDKRVRSLSILIEIYWGNLTSLVQCTSSLIPLDPFCCSALSFRKALEDCFPLAKFE